MGPIQKSLHFGLIAAMTVAGCSTGSDNGGLPGLLLDGKHDNYYSNVSAEFQVSGTLPLDLTEEEFNDPMVRDEEVALRLTAMGLYLTTYVTDKFRGIDSNGDGQITDDEVFFHNVDYGGFHAMVRNFTVEPASVEGDAEAGYVVHFTVDMAGPNNLLTLIDPAPGTTFDGNELIFEFQMPEGATMDPENVARRTSRRFDPSTHDGTLETIRATARPLPEPGNAYPAFDAFTADGVYEITLFYGHDYNDSRSDLSEAEEAYDALLGRGFRAPDGVASFDDLGHAAGPFVRDAFANGQPIRMEVRIFHSEMFTTERSYQHDLALEELVTRDVFFYNGHAGPYYGFYLDANGEAEVGYQEFAEAPFDPDRQQLFIAQGCQTYSQYSDMMYANPAKSEENLDVVVTVNYSYGRGTISILNNLIQLDGTDHHMPVDFYEIIADLNNDWVNNWKDVFYGVTGIDGNTQIHPYGNVDAVGNTCADISECGDPIGNMCVDHEGSGLCAVRTLSPDACPDGMEAGSANYATVCIRFPDVVDPVDPPAGAVIPEAPGDLIVTELSVNPDSVSDTLGEWIEIHNPLGTTTLTLTGCLIGDNHSSGHVINENVEVPPGGYVVLARNAQPGGFTPDYVYGGSLQLSNKQDQVVLTCNDVEIDRFEYRGRIRAGRTLSLSADAVDATANDDRANWCYGTATYNDNGGRTDDGSPAAANPVCE